MLLRDALSSLRFGRGHFPEWRAARAVVACCVAIWAVGGCERAKQAVATLGGGDERVAQPVSSLSPVVYTALETPVIDTSTLEHREASPGNTFVVLDVAVRNPDTRPQVFSEGSLVSVDATRERSFPTPVTLLAGEFLSLQVLQPASAVRGKIAYEVPSGLQGVLYWQPGAGSQRILLHPGAPPSAGTLGNAPEDDTGDVAPSAPLAKAAQDSTPQESTAKRVATAATPERNSPVLASASRAVTAATPTPAPTAPRQVASVAPPRPSDVPASNEQARTLACQALLSRNDPDEKARYLAFFARECADYAMPSSWRPSVASASPRTPSPPAPPVPAPQSGPAFDCNQAWSRAEHLVCADAVLSLMDRQLERAYGDARLRVADPLALQREEEDWRHRVRDACDSIPCIERAYDRRTAELESVGRNAIIR